MKIPPLAVSVVIGFSLVQSSSSFVPTTLTRNKNGHRHPQLVPLTSIQPTHSATALFTATEPSSTASLQETQAELGLEYAPIYPFGKNAAANAAGKNILGGKGCVAVGC
jgi:hypothetical protein